MKIGELFRKPVFWIAVCLMVCSGASELSMSQWASAYAEAALGLSKTIGDLAGPCMFAIMMGISRVIFGKYGDKMDLMKFMAGSGILCVICYLLASLCSNPAAGLIGCIVCGFSVGIMWPGTISISSKKFPAGGTAMFALLAMAGDLTPRSRLDRIAVIREYGNKRRILFHDIRSKDIFTSPYYYLQQNDIVYVEPTNMKATEQAQRKLSTWSMILSFITTITSLVLLTTK